jgi:hypothetical protein
MTDEHEALKIRFRDQLRRAKAVHDEQVERARRHRNALFREANDAGLSYYMIAQLTQTDGKDAGYGGEFVRKECQRPADPVTGAPRPDSTDPSAPVVE